MRSDDQVGSSAQDALLRALAEAPADQLPLDAVDRALLHYADILTRKPISVTAAEIDALRAVGLADRAIHDTCAIVAYFAFVNRIADGLGVELEN